MTLCYVVLVIVVLQFLGGLGPEGLAGFWLGI